MRPRSHGERLPPLCALSMAQLLDMRRQALALCVELGWKPTRLYDALRLLVSSTGGNEIAGGSWQAVQRPADAPPVDAAADARFLRQLMVLEREARALNDVPAVPGHRGVDMPGIGLALSPEERTVAALDWRHRHTKPKR